MNILVGIKEEPESMVTGLPVLGDDDWLLAHDSQ